MKVVREHREDLVEQEAGQDMSPIVPRPGVSGVLAVDLPLDGNVASRSATRPLATATMRVGEQPRRLPAVVLLSGGSRHGTATA